MNVLTSFAPSLVAALAVFIVAWISKGRFDLIDKRFELIDKRFDSQDEQNRQVREDIRQMRGEIAGLRSDLTQIALAVGAKPRPETA